MAVGETRTERFLASAMNSSRLLPDSWLEPSGLVERDVTVLWDMSCVKAVTRERTVADWEVEGRAKSLNIGPGGGEVDVDLDLLPDLDLRGLRVEVGGGGGAEFALIQLVREVRRSFRLCSSSRETGGNGSPG